MRAYYAFDRHPFDEPAARAALEALIGDDTLGRVWLITEDAEAVGYVVLAFGYSLEYHGRDAFIDELYLAEAARGRGIGRLVMGLVEDEARALGVRALHLEVARPNHRAQALYRSAGFAGNDRFLLSKRLGAPTDDRTS